MTTPNNQPLHISDEARKAIKLLPAGALDCEIELVIQLAINSATAAKDKRIQELEQQVANVTSWLEVSKGGHASQQIRADQLETQLLDMRSAICKLGWRSCGCHPSWDSHSNSCPVEVILSSTPSPANWVRREVAEAAWRLKNYSYHDWSVAGGLDECRHGIAAGIHCQRCDSLLIEETYKQLTSAQRELER